MLEPVRQAKVAEVGNRLDAELPHLREDLVRETPVIDARASVHAVIGRAVAQITYPELAHQPKIVFPTLVMETLLQLVDAMTLTIAAHDRRVAALDTGGEHEFVIDAVSYTHLTLPTKRIV